MAKNEEEQHDCGLEGGEWAEIKKDIRNKVNVGREHKRERMEKLKSRDKGSQQKGTNFEFIGFVIQDFYIFLYAAPTFIQFSLLASPAIHSSSPPYSFWLNQRLIVEAFSCLFLCCFDISVCQAEIFETLQTSIE